MKNVDIYGASDDFVVLYNLGDTQELDASQQNRLQFSDGTSVEVAMGEGAVWRVTLLNKGTKLRVMRTLFGVADDSDEPTHTHPTAPPYSDVMTLEFDEDVEYMGMK